MIKFIVQNADTIIQVLFITIVVSASLMVTVMAISIYNELLKTIR